MKVLIDISNWLYNAIMEHKEPHYSQSLGDAVRDGIPIPDNATNGDVIKAIFPNSEYEILYNTVFTEIDNGLWFTLDWWNTPYQKGGNSEYLGGELYQGEFEMNR